MIILLLHWYSLFPWEIPIVRVGKWDKRKSAMIDSKSGYYNIL